MRINKSILSSLPVEVQDAIKLFGKTYNFTNKRDTFRAFKWYLNMIDFKLIEKLKLRAGIEVSIRKRNGYDDSFTIRVPYELIG